MKSSGSRPSRRELLLIGALVFTGCPPGQTGLPCYRLAEIENVADGTWTCLFTDRLTETAYCVRVRSEPAAVLVRKSCRDDGPVPLSQFRLEKIERYEARPQANPEITAPTA